jgi:hypothetical protein
MRRRLMITIGIKFSFNTMWNLACRKKQERSAYFANWPLAFQHKDWRELRSRVSIPWKIVLMRQKSNFNRHQRDRPPKNDCISMTWSFIDYRSRGKVVVFPFHQQKEGHHVQPLSPEDDPGTRAADVGKPFLGAFFLTHWALEFQG